LTPYSFVWLLRDSSYPFTQAMREALTIDLQAQLKAQFWHIIELDVQEDYIYLYAEVPGETAPNELIREVMNRTAELIEYHNQGFNTRELWADSYLVLTPGRAMDIEDIQRFIVFSRG
jgi:REP element-mobilizing transposase RayT